MDWSGWWIHLLLYPVYQLIGTARHEACHALAAISFGARITSFSVLPHRRNDKWYLGYVGWAGELTADQERAVLMFPYLGNVLMVTLWLAFIPANREAMSFHHYAFWTVVLLVSPVVDTLWNMSKWVFRRTGDFAGAHGQAPAEDS